jgi:phage portal protein BeeE
MCHNGVMNKPKSKTTIVPKNLPWGVYVWRCKDGSPLSDGRGNVLSLNGFKNDLAAIAKMRDAATALGHGDGQPAFLAGSRQISEMEYEYQMEQFLEGKEIEGDYDI